MKNQISEDFKKRMKELSGVVLIKEDNVHKLMNFGILEPVAQMFGNIDDKLSIFFADIIIREFANMNNVGKQNIKEIIPLINQNELIDFIERNQRPITTILEWIKSPLRQGNINLKEIKTLSKAFEMATEWHNSLNATGIIEDEKGLVIKQYPEGFYWIDLQTNSSSDEGGAMGHCGTDSRATTLFSLRDNKKEPHVTIAYNANKKIVTQIKGKNNRKPVSKYMEYVYDFLRELSNLNQLVGFTWSYTPYGGDISEEEIKYILGAKKYFFYLKSHMNDHSNIRVH